MILRTRVLPCEVNYLPFVAVCDLLFHLLNRTVVVDDGLIAPQRLDLSLNCTTPLLQIEVTLGRQRELPRSILNLEQVWVVAVEVRREPLTLLWLLKLH